MIITIVQGAFLPVPPKMGGAVEKMWYALGKEFFKSGHQVLHISRQFEFLPINNIDEGVEHLRIPGYKTPRSGVILKLLDFFYSIRALKKINRKSNIIITNTFWLPIIAGRLLRKRIIVDVQRMPKGQMKFYKGVGSLRANSSAVELEIRKELSNFRGFQLFTVPNPLPFIPVKVVNLKSKAKTILFVGRVHPEKGLGLLIEAFLKANVGKLRIVGPWQIEYGGGGKQYFESLKKLAIGNHNVEFIGPIFNDIDLHNEYENASIFVYPSLAEKGETFGIAPLEAMAWGCVPIVSDLLCFHDFIENEQNGLIFDHRANNAVEKLAEKIIFLFQNERLREHMALKAMDVRETHSTKNISLEFEKFFLEIIG